MDSRPSPAPAELPRRPERRTRIVATASAELDEEQRHEQWLVERLLGSEGSDAISRAATELVEHDYELPRDQHTQLQLLEHIDETVVRAAIATLTQLLGVEEPIKRPVLDRRLRRLEECAEDPRTRADAAALRRHLRRS